MKLSDTYRLAKEFKSKYPSTIAWRVGSHCKVIDKHLNPGEEVVYVFLGQKNRSSLDIMNTNIVVLTNKRLLFATKRLLFGYFYTSVTLDMFNDLSVRESLIWGKVIIDTINEKICLSNISKNALPEIETQISEFIFKEKQNIEKKREQLKENSKKSEE